MKIHEDIILIEVNDKKVNKFEEELFIPLITKLIRNYCSHNLVSFLINLASDCDLNETLRVLKIMNDKMRGYINERKQYIAPYLKNKDPLVKPQVHSNGVMSKTNGAMAMEKAPSPKIEVKHEVKMEEDIKQEEGMIGHEVKHEEDEMQTEEVFKNKNTAKVSRSKADITKK